MKFTSTQHSGVTVLHLSGSLLGGPDAGTLKARLGKLVEEGKKHVVLDLGEVEFMNSSGLAMLINSLTMVRNSGGDLKLANVSAKIGALITITRLASVLQTCPTVKDAVAALKK
jgi:anti-sigma B factor antagonist